MLRASSKKAQLLLQGGGRRYVYIVESRTMIMEVSVFCPVAETCVFLFFYIFCNENGKATNL